MVQHSVTCNRELENTLNGNISDNHYSPNGRGVKEGGRRGEGVREVRGVGREGREGRE